jgi:hypothetical protein
MQIAPGKRWTDALRRGDFAAAWRLSDAGLQEWLAHGPAKHRGPRHLQRIWRGEALAGKRVLVRCYHGLGDTLQFARFAEPLRSIAREVIFWTQPELLNMLKEVEGIDRVVPLHDGTPDVVYDADIEVMELAHALRVTARDISGRVPYLRRTTPLKWESKSSLNVGVVWEAGDWDRRRCVPWSLLSRLAAIPGVRLLSLQQGPARQLAHRIAARDIAAPDIESLAAAILGLDLLVSVDTMVAHLGGALGAPVWTLLHADCDWRWPAEGRTTVWYPTMGLFHQRSPGDWQSAIAEVARELQTMAAAIPALQDAQQP